MYLFKERVKYLIGYVVSGVLTIGFITLVIWGISLIPDIIVAIFILGIFGLGIVAGLFSLLYWLLIEPFMESELYWKMRSKLKR